MSKDFLSEVRKAVDMDAESAIEHLEYLLEFEDES